VVLPKAKFPRTRLVPYLDIHVRTISRGKTNNEINFNIRMWSLRTYRQSQRLENLTIEMDNYEINVVDLSEVQ
jgi:hypothetical protein